MRPFIFLFVATLLATYVLGGGLAGALEKIYLWDCYQIAWEWQGDKQQYILPLGKGKDLIVNHRGSGPDVAPPGPGSENYYKLIENMNAMVRDARKAKGDGPFQSLIAEMDRILDQVVAIRLSEFEKWAERDLKKDFAKNKINVIMEDKTDSRYNLQWKAVNYRETVKANKALFASKTDRKNFRDWLSNYGSPDFKPSSPTKPYTEGAGTHFKVMKAWRDTVAALKATC
ncbi:hypothetical protein PoHVEF18_009925 [Penicillium ochrochloron]